MTIRRACEPDVPEIVAMAHRFVSSTPYGDAVTLSAAHVEHLARRLLTAEDGALFVAQGAGGELVGMLAMHAFHHPMTGDLTAAELVWWVEPESRGRVGVALLRAAEQWAVDLGATTLIMVAPAAAPKVGQFYAAMRYAPIEMSYQKRI